MNETILFPHKIKYKIYSTYILNNNSIICSFHLLYNCFFKNFFSSISNNFSSIKFPIGGEFNLTATCIFAERDLLFLNISEGDGVIGFDVIIDKDGFNE